MEMLVMDKEFWRNKKVFVTGHTGFKGSWMSLWLKELGAQVTGFALAPPTSPSHFDLINLENKIDSHIGDIREIGFLKEVIYSCQPEIVIHMAAQSLVLDSYEDPIATYMTNVIGTLHVFEAVRQCSSVKTVINITTDKCYENKEWCWGYRENEPMGGHDPYSSSKGCAELLTKSYQKSFFTSDSGVNLASVRAGNVIGGGDWAENRLIPDFIKAIISGEPAIIRSPDSIRPWQHVLEPIAGYLILAEKMSSDVGRNFVGGWNFGPADIDVQTVSQISDKLCNFWGEGVSWKIEDQNKEHPHEATYLKLDCSKARGEIGWKPLLDLDKALDWIVEWYKCFQQNGDMTEITLRQIRRYQEILDSN